MLLDLGAHVAVRHKYVIDDWEIGRSGVDTSLKCTEDFPQFRWRRLTFAPRPENLHCTAVPAF